MKGDDYFFDLIFRITKKNDKRMAETIKERADIGANKFPQEFEWNYENFLKFYGKDIIEKDATPIVMATKKQVERILQLIATVKIDEETINKWMTKADVDEWEEMTGERIQKCIDFLEKKIEEVKPVIEKRGVK